VLGDCVPDVVVVNAESLGFNNNLLDFVLEETGFFGFGGGGALGDNRGGTGTDFEKAGIDKAGNDLMCCVRVDFEVAAEDADRRKIVARTEPTGDDGFCGGIDNLLVKGRAGSEVDVEGDHSVCTMTDSTACSQLQSEAHLEQKGLRGTLALTELYTLPKLSENK